MSIDIDDNTPPPFDDASLFDDSTQKMQKKTPAPSSTLSPAREAESIIIPTNEEMENEVTLSYINTAREKGDEESPPGDTDTSLHGTSQNGLTEVDAYMHKRM